MPLDPIISGHTVSGLLEHSSKFPRLLLKLFLVRTFTMSSNGSIAFSTLTPSVGLHAGGRVEELPEHGYESTPSAAALETEESRCGRAAHLRRENRFRPGAPPPLTSAAGVSNSVTFPACITSTRSQSMTVLILEVEKSLNSADVAEERGALRSAPESHLCAMVRTVRSWNLSLMVRCSSSSVFWSTLAVASGVKLSFTVGHMGVTAAS
ncbi:hypothetical protein EYF80_029346 [Liparis tanakae]|uniref:Uncharacterized protein n=1 Tax=Liparis tanakae TaxID=230148 RepID=A0A4Z2H5D4_9TELE|nr:hypothetical protein EYF80_029346 [Liparis tanakae]